MLNRFAALDLGAGAPEADAGHDSDGSVGSNAPPAAAAELQTRYLVLQAQCLRSEELRRQSEAVMRDSAPGRWTLSAELLRAAYELLEQAMGSPERVVWWVQLAQWEEGQGSPPSGDHDVQVLIRLRDAVNVEQTTLGEMKVRAIRAANRRMELLELKLNPMQEERNVVRASIGEHRWRNNPAPKLTYAERIALLTAEMADLQGALLVLSSLQFSTSVALR